MKNLNVKFYATSRKDVVALETKLNKGEDSRTRALRSFRKQALWLLFYINFK